MAYQVVVPHTFRKRLAKKTPAMQAAIASCVAQLSADPWHPGLRTSKVQGADDVLEARIDRGNRLTWRWDDGRILLLNHCNHSIVGRKP